MPNINQRSLKTDTIHIYNSHCISNSFDCFDLSSQVFSAVICKIPNQITDSHAIMSWLRSWLDMSFIHDAGTCQNNSSHN